MSVDADTNGKNSTWSKRFVCIPKKNLERGGEEICSVTLSKNNRNEALKTEPRFVSTERTRLKGGKKKPIKGGGGKSEYGNANTGTQGEWNLLVLRTPPLLASLH